MVPTGEFGMIGSNVQVTKRYLDAAQASQYLYKKGLFFDRMGTAMTYSSSGFGILLPYSLIKMPMAFSTPVTSLILGNLVTSGIKYNNISNIYHDAHFQYNGMQQGEGLYMINTESTFFQHNTFLLRRTTKLYLPNGEFFYEIKYNH
jgi:hypothetical protein